MAGKRKRELMLDTGYSICVRLLPCEIGIKYRMCRGPGFCLLEFRFIDF